MSQKIANFVEFRSFGKRVGSNYVGITKNGTISLYSGFYQKYDIKQYENCVILYDKAQGLLGLQFGDRSLGEGSFVINHDSKRTTGTIAAQNFFKINGELVLEQLKGRYIPEIYDDSQRKNVFMIDLNNKVK